jgi:homoserine O-acetyltransferase
MVFDNPPATEMLMIPGVQTLEKGGELNNPVVAVERLGPEHAPVILIFTGLSPGAHVASSEKDKSPGWWEFMVGAGKAIDTNKFQVICVNSIGSCLGSTGPASINPETGDYYGADFPDITIWDIARLTGLALAEIDVQEIFCVVGPSMGGMTALAWVISYPQTTQHMINISAAVEADPFAIAIRSVQREIIYTDPEFMDGNYAIDAEPLTGMMLARKLGLISYRSTSEWRNRFGRKEDGTGSDIESYLQFNAEKFCRDFDANCYIKLSQTMNWFSLMEEINSPVDEFAASKLESALVVSASTDILFPPHQQRELTELLNKSGIETTHHEIDCPHGHDAFLIDEENFCPVVGDYLGSISA